jgi:hypothetical protein
MTTQHTESGRPFDLILLAGDISYATVDPPGGEVEWTWDALFLQNEAFVSTAPWLVTVGNHEEAPGHVTWPNGTAVDTPFAAFQARYTLPSATSGGWGNFWYSYNLGPVHFVSTSSEHDDVPGSSQYEWLAADLAAVERTLTPWIVFQLHRPILCSVTDEESDHWPGGPRSAAMEPLFKQFSVDVVIAGHQHCYERTNAVFNGTVTGLPTGANNTYVNPTSPLYVVQGTSGATQEQTWVTPQPAWSAVRLEDDLATYGFGRMTFSADAGGRTMHYDFCDYTGVVQDVWEIRKTA